MFSREEKKSLNTAFFNQFVRHMSRHHSKGGGGGRWESYKTGVKGLYFRMLTAPVVGIAIDIQQKDPEIRALLFDQFVELRRLLEAEWGDGVNYEQSHYLESGLEVSRISITLENAYFYDKEQWTEIISWYEKHLLSLDAFWDTVGDIVKGLAR
ncbi:DUF4268 domain-containing protein [Schleiferiaceae bacterium]|nr:DUF4268 domain-containing protein [Schleiferiaceae bacterium]